jgi:hypothetical protein
MVFCVWRCRRNQWTPETSCSLAISLHNAVEIFANALYGVTDQKYRA